jgi:hypothetical protein
VNYLICRFDVHPLEKDVDWTVSKEQYQSEIVKQGQQITDLLQKLHLYNKGKLIIIRFITQGLRIFFLNI